MTGSYQFPYDIDGDVLRKIQENGSDMGKPMVIDFHIAANCKNSGEQILSVLKNFQGRSELTKDDNRDAWTVTYSEKMLPKHADIIEMQSLLTQKSKPFGGYTDGWGTFGNKEKSHE